MINEKVAKRTGSTKKLLPKIQEAAKILEAHTKERQSGEYSKQS